VPGGTAQNGYHLVESGCLILCRRSTRGTLPPVGVASASSGKSGERRRFLHLPGGDGAAGHVTKFRFVRTLRIDASPCGFHGQKPDAAVGAVARQHEAPDRGAIGIGKRGEQRVERQPCTLPIRRRRKCQTRVGDAEELPWRNDVDIVGRSAFPQPPRSRASLCGGRGARPRGLGGSDRDAVRG